MAFQPCSENTGEPAGICSLSFFLGEAKLLSCSPLTVNGACNWGDSQSIGWQGFFRTTRDDPFATFIYFGVVRTIAEQSPVCGGAGSPGAE